MICPHCQSPGLKKVVSVEGTRSVLECPACRSQYEVDAKKPLTEKPNRKGP